MWRIWQRQSIARCFRINPTAGTAALAALRHTGVRSVIRGAATFIAPGPWRLPVAIGVIIGAAGRCSPIALFNIDGKKGALVGIVSGNPASGSTLPPALTT
jgi:hypothetical protein